jgi:hypothetical protein
MSVPRSPGGPVSQAIAGAVHQVVFLHQEAAFETQHAGDGPLQQPHDQNPRYVQLE